MASTSRSQFRFPYDIQTTLEPWREALGDNFDDVVAKMRDRDRALEDYIDPYCVSIAEGLSTPGTTASATYVDYPGPVDLVYRKRFISSQLMLEFSGGAFAGVVTGGVDVGLLINGFDFGMAHFFFNDVGSHRAFGGWTLVTPVFTGPPGEYTARLRWKYTGGGNVNVDGNDKYSIRISDIVSTLPG